MNHSPSLPSTDMSNLRRFLNIFSIVFAGEIIFSLPFHIARFFRPTLMDSLSITNSQLGDIFAIYGFMAMLAYLPGGLLADRFSAKKLMIISLIFTAIGGVYFAQAPSVNGLKLLYGFWGVTTIFLFWAPMLKVTRLTGGQDAQGKAFGILDGGRGLVAATMATIAVYLLSIFFPANLDTLSDLQRHQALITVIYFYTSLILLAALLLWLCLPNTSPAKTSFCGSTSASTTFSITRFRSVMSKPVIWYQALIVLTAYCCYKGLDYYGLYAITAFDYDELESAQLMAYSAFLRPISAVIAGVVADRFSSSQVILTSFCLALLSYLLFTTSSLHLFHGILIANVFISFVLVFAIRAVYFALIAESRLSTNVTGTSIGIISLAGFTPDVFFAPLTGRILDAYPGLDGFNQVFLLLALIAALGVFATYKLNREIKKHAIP